MGRASIGLAQNCFRPRFRPVGVEDEAVLGIRIKPCQQQRHLPHIVLSVACANAKAVQLHHLARKVFVHTPPPPSPKG
jgi:hypothetical protein